MSSVIFGAEQPLGRALTAQLEQGGQDVLAIGHDEGPVWDSARSRAEIDEAADARLRERIDAFAPETVIYLTEIPAPVQGGLPPWIETFTRNVGGIERALDLCVPALRRQAPARVAIVMETPLRGFPDYDLKKGERALTGVRDSAAAACRSRSQKLAPDGIAYGALYHPDMAEGALRPTRVPDATAASRIAAAIDDLSMETTGMFLPYAASKR